MTIAITRRMLSAALLGAASIPLMGRAARADKRIVRIGFASIGAGNRQFTANSATATAHAEGDLEREFINDPVEIQWFFFAGAGPAVNEALANNQLDLALQGDLPSVIGRSNGLRTRIVMAASVNVPIYLAVPTESDIRGVGDLRGRTVAWHRGTNLHLSIVKVLAANGLTERDLKVVNMDFATADAALATRTIDAQFASPTVFNVVAKGLARIVYTTKGDNPAFGRNSSILATEQFEQANPDLLARIVTALVRRADWASDETNRAALFQGWTRSGYPVEAFRNDFEGDSLAYRNSPLIDDFLIQQYRTQAQQALEFRLIRRPVEVEGWFEPRYVDAAVKTLGLEHRWTRRDAGGRPVDLS